MKSIWDYTYIVTDVETTGSDPVKDRITEIACFVVHGGEIVSEYSSLINPHKNIPGFIVNMTGITQDMVNKAPEANVVMKEVNKLASMNDVIFVAHNVRFDYLFVQNTMIREGFKFELPQLCSLKLARRMLPRDIKKNVGSLASYYNLNILHRHRAFGDAEATAYILIELLEKAYNEYNIKTIEELLEFQNKQPGAPKPNLEKYTKLLPYLDELPNSAGVFYLLNENEEMLYIGMAKSLKDKILSYFSAEEIHSKKISNMLESINEIRWAECSSDLEALILETNEINRFHPSYNHTFNKYRSYPFIKVNKNKLPIIQKCYSIEKDGEYFGPFANRFAVDELIEELYSFFPAIKSSVVNNDINNLFLSKEIDDLIELLKGNNSPIVKKLNDDVKKLLLLGDTARASKKQELIKELELLKLNNFNNTLLKNNVIIVKPISYREKTLEIIFVQSGIMKKHLTVGRKQDIEFVKQDIQDFYFSNDKTYINNGVLDELRIINSYMYRHKSIGKFIYIENKTEKSIFLELKEIIYNYDFDNLIYLM